MKIEPDKQTIKFLNQVKVLDNFKPIKSVFDIVIGLGLPYEVVKHNLIILEAAGHIKVKHLHIEYVK